MKRRGFVFTLDAILAVVLLTMFVTSILAIQSQTANVYNTYSRTQDKYIAENVLYTLRTTPLEDLVPSAIINNWISKGVLNTSLVTPSMTPIDIVATYWATGPIYNESKWKHNAEIILGYILNNTLRGYDYELLINNYTSPYLRKFGANPNNTDEISPATLVISGYAFNQTPRGYMARAFLTKVEYTRRDLFGWFRVLAAATDSEGSTNTLVVERNITIPAINKSSIYKANGNFIHRYLEREYVYINGNYTPLTASEPNAPDVRDYLLPGVNSIKMVFNNSPEGEIGIGSGTTLYVEYRSNSLHVKDPGLVKGYYIDSKYTGFMYLLENFVPGNITSIDMQFKVKGAHEVRLYYGLGGNLYLLLTKTVDPSTIQTVKFTDSEIRNALLSYGISYENLSKMVFDFVLAVDAKYDSTKRQFYYGGAGDNSYPCKTCGGVGRRILYGYPDSFVKISYIPRILITQYSIPLSIPVDYSIPSYTDYTGRHCGGGTYKSFSISYTLPHNALPWYVDLWVGYCYYTSTIQTLKENQRTFYSGPNGLYSIRISYSKMKEWMMEPGTNVFVATLLKGVNTGGTSYRYHATRGIIKYFIQGYVGYGNIFPYLLQGYPSFRGYNLTYWYDVGGTPQSSTILVGDPPYLEINVSALNPGKYAVDDAILRLFNKLNYYRDVNPDSWNEKPYDGSEENPIDMILASNIRIETASMGNIPSLYPPITITLRVWREG